MRRYAIGVAGAFLALGLVAVGCAKKSTESANPANQTFDSLSGGEDLAQLPQASGSAQQAAVEALPVETSPVTQGATAPAATVPPAFVSTDMAAGGDTSLSEAQKIQTALKNSGFYSGAIDGKIGPASKKAIEAFQKSHALKVDGKVGSKTWAALKPFLSGPAPVDSSAQVPSSGN